MVRSGMGSISWRVAAAATVHCLTGCAIGEVLGMVVSTALHASNAANIFFAVVLAFVLGYALTIRGVLRGGATFAQAAKIALAADSVSILVMEVVDNTTEVLIPNALNAQLNTWLFWWSMAVSLTLAFVVATPVNRVLMSRGLGHARVHAMHQHEHQA